MNPIGSYYNYLCDRIGIDPAECKMECVCSMLIVSPFIAVLKDDENQIEQALYMRREYARDLDPAEKSAFYRAMGPCSVFEILVEMVEKMHYNLIGNPLASSRQGALFFELLDNLELGWINDDAFGENPDACSDYIEDAVRTFVYREYDENGANGGLFPVTLLKNDVTKMSLLRQMEAYLIDRYDALA